MSEEDFTSVYIKGFEDGKDKIKKEVINYLEDKIKELNNLDKSNTCYFYRGQKKSYQEILDKVKRW